MPYILLCLILLCGCTRDPEHRMNVTDMQEIMRESEEDGLKRHPDPGIDITAPFAKVRNSDP